MSSQPDFGRYSAEELRDILERIDRERFPERVAEIQARLLAMDSTAQAVDGARRADDVVNAVGISGLWRRFGAFFTDVIVLGTLGLVAGVVLREQFEALGGWGRLVGFAVTVTYFGFMESSWGGGQSLGKRLLGLKVMSKTGELLGRGAAFARAGIFSLAYLINGAGIDLGHGYKWLGASLVVLLFGLIFGLFYLLIFNRRTRQSLHDLAVGAFVVRTGTTGPDLPVEPVWRGHFLAIGTAVLIAIGGSVYLAQQTPSIDSKILSQLHAKILALSGVSTAEVKFGTSTSNNVVSKQLLIVVKVTSSIVDREKLAPQIAKAAMETMPEAMNQDVIVVYLTSGYDIGIFSSFNSMVVSRTPNEWKAMLSKAE